MVQGLEGVQLAQIEQYLKDNGLKPPEASPGSTLPPDSLPGKIERVSDMTPAEIDAKIAAGEARAETGLERAMGEVRTEFAALRGDIRELKAATASKATVITTGVALFLGLGALVLGVLAFGGDQFNTGREVGGQMAQVSGKLDALSAQVASYSEGQMDSAPESQKGQLTPGMGPAIERR